jgi:hypothetical protein
MRRKTACVRKLHSLKEDMCRLPASAPECQTLRGNQNRTEAARGLGTDSECAPANP